MMEEIDVANMNLGFKKLNVSHKNKTDNLGEVYIEPLDSGFGRTYGNSLRRILLSSLPGASVVGFSIDGMSHEFQQIDGAIEDGIELINHLKKMRFSMEGNEALLTFKKSKNGTYYASDLELPKSVNVLTPEVPFLRLTGEKEVDVSVYLAKGRGYEHADSHEYVEGENIIKTDGMFSPVNRVQVDVEKMRVGQDSSFERLILTVETDGSVLPEESVVTASHIMREQLAFVDDMKEYVEEIDVIEKEKQKEEEILSMKIEELGLTVRSYNSLKNNGYYTVGEILTLTRKQLGNLKQVGDVSRDEIENKIADLGYQLRQE